jgi:hypothetical protein
MLAPLISRPGAIRQAPSTTFRPGP